MFDTAEYEVKMQSAFEHFTDELKQVRTGRAHASILDGVQVEVYGTRMPLNQAANVTAPEAQMLLVSPFDPSNIAAITAAIRDNQTLGLNPSDDGRVIRVPIPALTEERRKLLVKQTSEKVEEARIAVRNIRQDALKDAKKQKEAKELSEDDVKRVEKEVDAVVADFNQKIETAFKEKEKDILTL